MCAARMCGASPVLITDLNPVSMDNLVAAIGTREEAPVQQELDTKSQRYRTLFRERIRYRKCLVALLADQPALVATGELVARVAVAAGSGGAARWRADQSND